MFKGVKKVGPKHNLLKKVQAKQTGPKQTRRTPYVVFLYFNYIKYRKT